MVDSKHSMDIYKLFKISIGTVMRNAEMLKFIPNHLVTKKIFEGAVKKNSFRSKISS